MSDLSDWLALGALVAAISSAVWAGRQVSEARRSADAAREQARAATAAVASAKRAADAAVAAEKRAEAVHARQQFGWRIERAAVGLYILRNVGWSDATAVGISSDIEVGLQGAVEHLDLAAGQGVSFVGMLGSAPPKAIDVRITWTAPGETEPRVWVEPFPDRPASVAEFDADIRRPFRQ